MPVIVTGADITLINNSYIANGYIIPDLSCFCKINCFVTE